MNQFPNKNHQKNQFPNKMRRIHARLTELTTATHDGNVGTAVSIATELPAGRSRVRISETATRPGHF
jgi:hypothetical protein